jgi:glycosyltransferase involved in cell wall biosynthesis
MRPWHVGVLIPARDEEDLVSRCLVSVLEAKKALRNLATADIVLVVDNSTDRTSELARDVMKRHGTVLQANAGCVGTARRLAARQALARYSGPLDRCWLANTDADSVVSMDWLTRQLAFAEEGVQVVAGTVNVDNFQEHGPDVPRRFRQSYEIASDGSHGHVHGANLGVRADMYVRAGGWDHLPTAEDHDLWARLKAVNAVTRSTNSVEVVTSGRRQGRAPHGFADALAAHNYVRL